VFLGQYTISDLKALLAAKTHDVNALSDAFKAFHAEWARKDGAALANWLTDWGAFWNRWQTALSNAKTIIATSNVSPIPASQFLADGAYKSVLRALTRTQGQIQKGDFQDLYSRLSRAGAQVDMTGAPQTSTRDLDLDMYNATNKAAHAIEKVPLVGPLLGSAMQDLGLGRETADRPTEADVSKAKWGVVAIVGGIFGAILLILRIEK